MGQKAKYGIFNYNRKGFKMRYKYYLHVTPDTSYIWYVTPQARGEGAKIITAGGESNIVGLKDYPNSNIVWAGQGGKRYPDARYTNVYIREDHPMFNADILDRIDDMLLSKSYSRSHGAGAFVRRVLADYN